MSNMFNSIIQEACCASLQTEYESLEKLDFNAYKTKTLSQNDIQVLSRKISTLPTEYLNIIFFRYCFQFSSSDTSDILEIDNVVGMLRYIKKMLSRFMNLDELIIDESSMKQASLIALQQYTSVNETEMMGRIHYSTEFRNKLKMIKSSQSISKVITLIIKRVAVFILVCAISFSTALVASAELREIFFNWVVNTFPKFSVFVPQNSDLSSQQIDVTLNNFIIDYLPENFILTDKTEMMSMIIYHYLDSNDRTLSITFANDVRFYKDTEDAIINEIPFNDNTAIWWERDSITHFIWIQDDTQCNITTELPIDEVIKIAENIKK
ncbi:MAG: DUF4367 domain-containing protein [Candidatus Fimivivens sp.]